ncbi:MAG: AAA family ATPase, partial [Planctomycetaceae bacterium]|nr:AAA family ATPase [Planctomycetaceae bacterium]
MKRLRRIKLINWHRFSHHTFEVEGHLLLMGDNGSGKSTILDALQVGLVGNMRSVRLNLAANEGGDRSLKSYVLGLVGGSNNGHAARTLRKNATSYILLEFADTESDETLVLGTVIDAHSDGRSPEKEHFIAQNSRLEDCPCLSDKNVPRRVREFKRELPHFKNIKRYARVEEYQQAVLRVLGGLDPEFFRLFVSGMAFRKIRHLRDFVYDFLLPEASEVQVVSLREAAERYRQLHELSLEAEQRIDLLDRIVANAQNAEASQKESDQLQALIDRAKLANCEAAVMLARNNRSQYETELKDATDHHTHCET